MSGCACRRETEAYFFVTEQNEEILFVVCSTSRLLLDNCVKALELNAGQRRKRRKRVKSTRVSWVRREFSPFSASSLYRIRIYFICNETISPRRDIHDNSSALGLRIFTEI
jgi:hypothetical protein